MKKMFLGVILSLSTILLVILSGCSKSVLPEFRKFNSFAKYKNFDEGVVAINVLWDVGGSYKEFTVTDSDSVNEIISVFNSAIMKKSSEFVAGENSSVEFVYADGTKVGASLLMQKEGNAYYCHTNSELRRTIRRIGRINNELETKLSDLSGYRGFHVKVSKVNVTWYNGNGVFENLTISDLNQIEAIKNLYLNATFNKSEKRNVPKSEIEFVYETNEIFKLGLYQIWDDGYYFDYSDSSVSEYIQQLVNEM